MYNFSKLYQSWFKRTEHIKDNCSHCNNGRYTLTPCYVTDRTREYYFTLNACPVCNFEDLQITQKVGVDFPNLNKFVKIKEK